MLWLQDTERSLAPLQRTADRNGFKRQRMALTGAESAHASVVDYEVWLYKFLGRQR